MKKPRAKLARGIEFTSGCLAVFNVEQVTFKSPRFAFLKEQTQKARAKQRGLFNVPCGLAHI
jgi:hypothetical protein